MNLIVNQINYGLIKEENFTKKLMQEWLKRNDILTRSRHNKNKPEIAERIIKTIKTKIYKMMTANDSKSYLPYLNKIVEQYNNI